MQLLIDWTSQRPLRTALLFLVAAGLYFLAPVVFDDPSQLFGQGHRDTGAEKFAGVFWKEIALAAVLVTAVLLIGWTKQTGLTKKPSWLASLVTVPLILFCIFIIFAPILSEKPDSAGVSLSAADWKNIWVTCVVGFLVGLFEELLFRGVVLHALMTRMSAPLAVFAAAVVFGLFHYVNWVSGQPLGVTTMQVIGAFSGGILFGAFVLWTGSLWPSILMHGLWDSAISISQTLQTKTSPDGKVVEITYEPLKGFMNSELIYGLILIALWLLMNWKKNQRVIG